MAEDRVGNEEQWDHPRGKDDDVVAHLWEKELEERF